MQNSLRSQHGSRWIVVTLAIAGLFLAAIMVIVALSPGTQVGTQAADAVSSDEPASVEPVEGTDLGRVILSAKAAERLGIETAPVRDEQVGGSQQKIVPYSAVLYFVDGTTWIYTSPEPLVFVRQPITIERIEGDTAILSEGPPADTQVASVGVAELFGIEFGVGH